MSRFLFLQGNATPFWMSLSRRLAGRGHLVSCIYLNGADRLFGRFPVATAYRGSLSRWPEWLSERLAMERPDAIIMFGRYRPHHRAAVEIARRRNVTVWNFDEGYWRPGYVTCERILADSDALLPCPPAAMVARAADCPERPSPPLPPGCFSKRAAFDVLYHLLRVISHPLQPFYRPHHAVDPFVEYAGHVPSLLLGPLRRRRGEAILHRMETGPAFLFPMQLDGDFQIRMRSPFSGNLEALALVLASFARAAPRDAILAIKAHPLDPGLKNWEREIAKLARSFDLAGRIFFFYTAALDRAVRACQGIVTINSTVGTLGLALGKPVLTLGEALYAIEGLTYQGEIDQFWTAAPAPDPAFLMSFRRLLAAEFLVPGDFFSRAGRQVAAEVAIARIEAEGRRGIVPTPSLHAAKA